MDLDDVEYEEYFGKYLKTATEEERSLLRAYFDGMNRDKTLAVIETGQRFNKSSAVNGTWFWRTVPALAARLPETELNIWLHEGQMLCRSSWECVLSFLKASVEVINYIDPVTFSKWAELGRVISRYSNKDAIWFFQHSENILSRVEQSQRAAVIIWPLKIMGNSWEAALACFKAWPDIICLVDEADMEVVLAKGLKLSASFPDEAAAYFLTVPVLLPKVSIEMISKWVESACLLANYGRGLMSTYFKATPELLTRVGKEGFLEKLAHMANLAQKTADINRDIAEAFLETTPIVLKGLKWALLEKWALLIERIAKDYSAQGAIDFVRSTPELLAQLDIKELGEWVDNGLVILKDSKRQAYFKLKSQESLDAISKFRSGTHLETVKKILLIYCEGLTGDSIILRKASDLPAFIHEEDKLFSSLDTRRIYLPDLIKVFSVERDNLRLYRAMMMHQIAHRVFGTNELSQEEFSELAGSRSLGLLFEFIEGNRVDYLALSNYSGLERDLKQILLTESSTDEDNYERETDSTLARLLNLLKNYLWLDDPGDCFNVSAEIKTLLADFWSHVIDYGASAGESLALSRQLLKMLGSSLTEQQQIIEPKNLIYRGRLKFDLIFASKVVDEEILQELPENQEKVSLLHRDTFNPHSQFQIALRKGLRKFYEDEENPYRMIAYYDEWDRTLNDYKKDWCTVREVVLRPSTGKFVTKTLEEHHGMINTLKRYFGMLRPEGFKRFNRQEDGDDIDIDAVTEAMIEKRAGVSPSGGFYIRRDKKERNVAVAFLLDLSYSTEEVISETGKTLLDVEKESVIVMAEALEVLGDKYAIYGFTSNGREEIDFNVVKDFEETYTQVVKQRFGGLKSYGMTRLAAAVRHAVYKLESVQAAIKILILLSDGRPFDFDYNSGITKDYEEFYAETDTRMALREAKMKGVNPFCITVDKRGYEYMDYIFGNVSYIIIDDVNTLPTKLTETYKNLTT